VLRYCSDGMYQMLFLFVLGGLIKIDSNRLMVAGGVGVKNTIDLSDSIKYAIDELPLLRTVEIVLAVILVAQLVLLFTAKKAGHEGKVRHYIVNMVLCVGAYGSTYIPYVFTMLSTHRWTLLMAVEAVCFFGIAYVLIAALYQKFLNGRALSLKKSGLQAALLVAAYLATYIDSVYRVLLAIKVPIATYCVIGLLGALNASLLKTRLGQNMRTVGQGMSVAASAGIDVNKTRMIAVIMSTTMASWGQLLSLQNLGTMQTYTSHDMVGEYSIAALLVGGATVHKANNKQALLGIVLFHTLFILSPIAGKELFGDVAIGEHFRRFVCYAVIALSLAMHAWKGGARQKIKRTESPDPSTTPAESGAAKA